MFRALLRLVVILVILVAAGTFFLGYWGSGRLRPAGEPGPTVGTSGHIDTGRAREAAAAVGEKTAQAANKAGEITARAATKAGEILSDGALTAKIKSKMALDDSVRARSIDVTTVDHVVTLSGSVRTLHERDRALQLARETDSVTRVVDKLTMNGGLR